MMPKRVALMLCGVAMLTLSVFGIARAVADNTSPWVSTATPTIQKSIELAPNVLPDSSNFDCVTSTLKIYLSTSTRQDCITNTPLGQVGSEGIMFAGSNSQIAIYPPSIFSGLQAVPNQSMLLTYSSAPITGSYLHFYRSIADKMPALPQFNGSFWQYTLTKNPDFSLRDDSGKLLVVNSRAMAFSANGNWMVVDLPFQGFVRINLATFEMQPFAPSMQQGSDYSSYSAQLSISNDGRYVALKPQPQPSFMVYDLNGCSGTSLPVSSDNTRCQNRNYWDDINAALSGFRAFYQPRFTNNDQLAFTAVYDYAPGNYKVAKFTLTAPGVSPTGMSYLGIGDSFASGEGVYAYTAETDTDNNRCHLSTKNYAAILTSQIYAGGKSVACSGAVVEDITNISDLYDGQVKDGIIRKDRRNSDQIKSSYTPGFLAQTEFIDQYRPDVVTLSVGGNDIGFSDIIKSCVSPTSRPATCYPTYEDRQELFQQAAGIFDRLVSTYRTVQKPGKRVYVIGYPQIVVGGGNCADNVHLDESEIRLANDLTDHLNTTISRAAAKAGVRYVDVSQAFKGHRLCEAKSWEAAVNGLTAGTDAGIGPLKFIGSESYHPNTLGHELLAQAIRLQTTNLTQPMPGTNDSLTAPSLPGSLDQQGLPKSGRSINQRVADQSLAPDSALRDQDISLSTDSVSAGLKPLSAYSIRLGGTTVGSAMTDASGALSTVIRIPGDAPTGFQLIDLIGPNLVGQSLDVTSSVYVTATTADTDGDGTPDDKEPCIFITPSGIDSDQDGIDDACDGYIAAPPPQKLSHLTASVTLTDNAIIIKR